MNRLLLGLIIGLLSLGCLANSKMYKWTDEHGRVHYSDKPPPKAEFEARDLPRAPDTDPSQIPSPRPADSEECLAARADLHTLENNSNVAMDLDGSGTPQVLDEATRMQQISRARAFAEATCAPRAPTRAPPAAPPAAPPVAEPAEPPAETDEDDEPVDQV